MAQPTPYVRATDFSTEEVNAVGGRSTVRTAALDAELDALGLTANETRVNIGLIQRDDGKVKDGVVELHTLAGETRALLAAGQGLPRGAWLTATAYALRDIVTQSGNTYLCALAHTSGTFATDLAANRWLVLSLGTAPAASAVPVTPTGGLASTNAQAALEELQTEVTAASALAVSEAADLALDLADASTVGKGDALLGVKVPSAGSVATTQDKVNEQRPRNAVIDFGADPTGTTDSTSALSAFFTAALALGGQHHLPKGTYRCTTLQIYATTPQRHDGAHIVGAGMNDVVIDFRGTGNVFDVRGIPTAPGSGTFFIWGLVLSNMTIDGANKTGTSDGIKLVGVWNSTLDCIKIKNLRHGVVSNGDLVYNANPDWSSTTNCTMIRCELERLTGWGFFNNVLQAAPGWEIQQNRFLLCGEGGIQFASGGLRITENAFAGCGWSSEVATPTANGTGIRFSGNVSATTQICVENNEFDTNFTSHVDLEYAGSVRFGGNRYIFNDRYAYGSVCPTAAAIRIAPFNVANAVQNIDFENETFRLDAGPTTGVPVCFSFVNNANVQNINASGGLFVDGNGSLSFTKVSGHTTSNFWARNNYQFELSEVSDLSRIIPGRPYSEYIGAITGTPSTAGGSALTVLPFNAQEAVNSSIFGTTLYNTTTGVFTCVASGYYDVDVVVALVSTISTDFNAIRLYRNGSIVQEWGGAGTGGARTWYSGRWRLFCSAGDTLDIREICSVSRVITGAYSQLRISLSR